MQFLLAESPSEKKNKNEAHKVDRKRTLRNCSRVSVLHQFWVKHCGQFILRVEILIENFNVVV